MIRKISKWELLFFDLQTLSIYRIRKIGHKCFKTKSRMRRVRFMELHSPALYQFFFHLSSLEFGQECRWSAVGWPALSRTLSSLQMLGPGFYQQYGWSVVGTRTKPHSWSFWCPIFPSFCTLLVHFCSKVLHSTSITINEQMPAITNKEPIRDAKTQENETKDTEMRT